MKLKNKRIVILSACVSALCIFIITGFFFWRSHVIKTHEALSFKTAQDFLAAARPADALAIIRKKERSTSTIGYRRWLDLEINALKQMRNIPRLLYLYEKSSDMFLNHEEASLLIGRSLLQMERKDLFEALRDSWRSRETQPGAWFALDVDALIIEGDIEKAMTLLNSRSFEGAQDCGRLTRLALLTAKDDLNASWNLLEKAYDLDSTNPDVRSFRAQILERLGKTPLARIEYVAAHLADLHNLFLRDQLAEFYRRTGNYGMALRTWRGGLNPPSLDFFWLKTLFWSRVAQPVDFDWTEVEIPQGDLKPLVTCLINLPEGTFWDAHIVEKYPKAKQWADQRQDVFWLTVLNELKNGSENRALELLQSGVFSAHSWHPYLENALKNALTYRRWGILVSWDTKIPPKSTRPGSQHQFFEQLMALSRDFSETSEKMKIPDEVDRLLRSPEAFTAVLLAAGWLEAALQLHRVPTIPYDFPDWVAYGLTQAYRYNRGIKEALIFAEGQKPSDVLDLLRAELLLADGQADNGIKKLIVLSAEDSDVGFRAAWLLTLANLDRGNVEEAHRIVCRQQRLCKSVTGKELLARIAISTGKTDEADRIYTMLEKESVEAKTYLARRAFASKDWPTARRLTEELLQYYPEKMQLRANLKAIAEEEGKI